MRDAIPSRLVTAATVPGALETVNAVIDMTARDGDHVERSMPDRGGQLMSDAPESGETPSEEKGELRSPKRGAIPTPREELEKATPYVPDEGERPDTEPT
jgi:hypothetical protein